MSANPVVRVCIDEHINDVATVVLVSNETTIAAMREARDGNLKSFDSVEALLVDLHPEFFSEAVKER